METLAPSRLGRVMVSESAAHPVSGSNRLIMKTLRALRMLINRYLYMMEQSILYCGDFT
jgi:hypothetical protein